LTEIIVCERFQMIPIGVSPRPIMTVFGTRPEIIKVAPVIRELDFWPNHFRTINIASGQHTTLAEPLIKMFHLRIDENLGVMLAGQSLNQLFAKVLQHLDSLLLQYNPSLLLVQGDTTTAVASAMAAFQRKIPVGHIEAGLRTDDPNSPFPEEMNRRIITRIATLHFAATKRNYLTLRREGIAKGRRFLTGNPVVDALHFLGTSGIRSKSLQALLAATEGLKRIVVTTHRRENFGDLLTGNLRVIRQFVEKHSDAVAIFPVHPNPLVQDQARAILRDHPRIFLIEPLDYPDFIGLLKHSWLIASDSGGIQEEAPSLGKQLLILRESTERPESIESGIARLTPTPGLFAQALDDAYSRSSSSPDCPVENPFGNGDSGKRIVRAIHRYFREIQMNPSRLIAGS
jgi:UDP-N-acetylglucosamine 2-epimerase (non-hydrolysing)